MDILKFTTAGSVDDGKSTLIGRLLYDTGNIKEDILLSVTDNDDLNLAHITDGLRAEREQGITIDVAYKYFSSKNRKYIITDAPGHFQFTKNLVTGASGVDVMIILIDAQNGITAQTKRHSQVASFLRIKHIVVAVNKMDIVGYDEAVFTQIKSEYELIARQLQLTQTTFIPISALCGDNISGDSPSMPWYSGNTLLHFLENHKPEPHRSIYARYIVQCQIKDDITGFAGKLLSGVLRTGEEVMICPQMQIAVIDTIIAGYDEVQEAQPGENICLFFNDHTKAKRGDLITCINNAPILNNIIEAELCWMDAQNDLQKGKEYMLRINSAETRCRVTDILYKTNPDTFKQYNDGENMMVNQFAKVRIATGTQIAYDIYSEHPATGRGIIIDLATNNTVGAFIIVGNGKE